MVEEELRKREDKKSGCVRSGRGERGYRNEKIREIEGGSRRFKEKRR